MTASGRAYALQGKSGALTSSRPPVTAASEYVARPVALPSTLRCCPPRIRWGDGHDPTATAAADPPSVVAGTRRPAGVPSPTGDGDDLDRAGAGRPHLHRTGGRGRASVARRTMDRKPCECRERHELFQGSAARREPREVPVPHDARRDRLVGRPDQRPGPAQRCVRHHRGSCGPIRDRLRYAAVSAGCPLRARPPDQFSDRTGSAAAR